MNQVIENGTYGKYRWFQCSGQVLPLATLVVQHHHGERVYISAFDSGPLKPTAEEETIGWQIQNGIMVSPPLNSEAQIPSDNFDEWYISPQKPLQAGKHEIFVNHSGFCLGSSIEPWALLEVEFWNTIGYYQPVTFVADGDVTVVVSQKSIFIDSILATTS